jgi:catalase
MKHNLITSSITAFILITGTATMSSAVANENKIEANDLVEMFENLGGKHPGFRKAHAKGLCASGTFMFAQRSWQTRPLER